MKNITEIKIVQILTSDPSTRPVCAVYNVSGNPFLEDVPTLPEHLYLEVCDVIALVEREGSQEVVGLVLGPLGYEVPLEANFMGYARDIEDAKMLYLSSRRRNP